MARKPTASRNTSRSLVADERGAIMVIALFFAIFLTALLFSVVGTGRAIFVREHLQDAVDGAVLSGAILNAQAMNLIVLANIVMAALLAILVALKAIEGLCIIAIGICAALAWITGGLTLGAIPGLNSVRATANSAHEEFKSVIFPALEALHDISSQIKEVTPELARAGAEARLLGNEQISVKKGMVYGKAEALPVEDDEYNELCRRAGTAVCSVVMEPLSFVPDKVSEPIKSACGGFAESLSMWFCDAQSNGSGGDSFPISRRQDQLYPLMPETKRCESGDQAACEWLLRAEFDDVGGCKEPGNCDAYEAFVAEARKQCDPNAAKKPEKYSYQLHTSTVVYRFDGKIWKRGAPKSISYTRELGKKRPPCIAGAKQAGVRGLQLPMVAYGYQTKVHPDNEPNVVLPVCSSEEPPVILPGLKKGDQKTVKYSEVTQILGCSRTEDKKVPIKRSKEDEPGEKDTKSPKRVIKDLKLGTEPFLLRGVAWRKDNDDSIRKLVELATFGKENTGTGFTRMLWLSRFSYAQAEYFYDGDGEADWMWNMNWKARLRRFAAPTDQEDVSKMKELCISATNERCEDLTTKFFEADLTAH